LPVCFDLFGHERSKGASKAYLWGLKGRFNEEEAGPLKDPEAVNAAARELYYREVQDLVEFLDKESAEEKPRLYVPDIKFRRGIGEHKDKRFSVKGEPLDEKAYLDHLQQVLPTDEDRAELRKITKEPDWIATN
jgi:hypothetical protein